MRAENKIKGSLDAIVVLNLTESDFELFEKIGDELHFVFISSHAYINLAKEFSIDISVSDEPKCTRCWHRCSSVGMIEDHDEVCSRCVENIENNGEQRSFV